MASPIKAPEKFSCLSCHDRCELCSLVEGRPQRHVGFFAYLPPLPALTFNLASYTPVSGAEALKERSLLEADVRKLVLGETLQVRLGSGAEFGEFNVDPVVKGCDRRFK